ncbi:MAG: hypothetical protein JXR44_01095 [Thiotrichales bacterium]|nr:hypothetical protein [Thiotrichales bacterium]
MKLHNLSLMFSSQATVQQTGYGLLLFVMVLGAVAALWASGRYAHLISHFQSQERQLRIADLQHVKQRLLTFAVLHPELYQTNSSSSLQPSAQIPSAGYFPCPDLDGDGFLLGAETQCGNPTNPNAPFPMQTGFVPDPMLASGGSQCSGLTPCMGFVPQKIVSREFYFAPAGRYYYVLDERFSFQNGYYSNQGQKRFAPFDLQALKGNQAPRLRLNQSGGYVLLLIDAGLDGLAADNADGDFQFFDQSASLFAAKEADKVIGVTLQEWANLMQVRACRQSLRLSGQGLFSQVDAQQAHWLNPFEGQNNPVGSNWRAQCDAP